VAVGQDDRDSEDGLGEKRTARRIRVRFRARYKGRNVTGSGLVRNISISGALIDPAEPPLLAGGEVRVRFSFFEDSLPVELKALVARETASGFAVRFTEVSPRVLSLLRLAVSRAEQDTEDGEQQGRTLLEPSSGGRGRAY
jgi:hypothetical protein